MGRLDRFETLARLGYAARGVVYLIVGGLAVAAASGGGAPADTRGALVEVLHQPFGGLLLALLAMGLAAYAAWRVAQAWFDLDGHGTGAKGLSVRGGLLASAVIHLALAGVALTMAAGSGSGGGGGAQDWTARLLAYPFGRVLVGAVGVAVMGAAAGHFAKAWTASFCRRMKADPDRMAVIRTVGRVGLAAKGLVFLLIGAFFLTAAWHADPDRSGGLREALLVLRDQPYGPWLLGLVAVGLVAFGLYSLIEARYRRIDAPAVLARLKAAV